MLRIVAPLDNPRIISIHAGDASSILVDDPLGGERTLALLRHQLLVLTRFKDKLVDLIADADKLGLDATEMRLECIDDDVIQYISRVSAIIALFGIPDVTEDGA